MSVHPLALLSPDRLAGTLPMAELAQQPGRQVTTVGVRLPGRTGGKGFFLSDGQTYVIAIPADEVKSSPVWDPLIVQSRWRLDEWGGGWLQVEEMRQA